MEQPIRLAEYAASPEEHLEWVAFCRDLANSAAYSQTSTSSSLKEMARAHEHYA